MARKVFLSVLGSTNYSSCFYVKGEYKSKSIRYVQLATLEIINAHEWDKKDVGFILVTNGERGSYETNWVDNGHVKYNSNEKIIQKGLCSELSSMNLPFEINAVPIVEGNDEGEIWEIFNTIFNLIKEDDEVYIDITHGFRYLPLLTIVLLNYSKFLKRICVNHISYGNFEGRNKENDEAQIIDLTTFSELQDWTNAANNFISFGNADRLFEIAKKGIKPFSIHYKGSNESLNKLNLVLKNLPEFISNIELCRGKSIIENKEGFFINNNIKTIDEYFISPLNPIMKEIEKKIYPFSNKDNLMNGFNAVKWCIDNNLIQQGFTILQENMISLVLAEINFDVEKQLNRDIASASFKIALKNIDACDWIGEAALQPEITKSILINSKLIMILKNEFGIITELRNDLNHSGYRENPVQSKKFKGMLSDKYCSVLSKINSTC